MGRRGQRAFAAAGYCAVHFRQDRRASTALAVATGELHRLAFRDPAPSAQNVDAARVDAHRLRGFVRAVEEHFIPAKCPANLGPMEFRVYLDTTVGQLRQDARRSGVQLPPNYWFSFASQRGAMTFSAATLPPLAMQLSDIRDLCGTLFQAKVNALAWLKRAPIDVQDSPGSPDYLSSRPITNKVTIAMPYELAFHGFSSDLAAVLEGLARLPQCFVVSGLTVEPLQDPAVAGTSVPALAETRLLPPAHDALPVDRYRQQRPNRPVYVHPTAATVLDQKPLRFVLSVQAVRLRSEARAGLSAVGSDR